MYRFHLIQQWRKQRNNTTSWFTDASQEYTIKYNVNKLVYFEDFATMPEAIAREKQIKGGSRQKKIDLIKKMNPEWEDLYEKFFV